jgi:hypothetical protein
MTVDEVQYPKYLFETREFPRHVLEGPELSLQGTFSSLGFPVEIRTNSPRVLSLYAAAWGICERRYETDPILVHVRVVDSGTDDCPPAPEHRILYPLIVTIADPHNYSITDLAQNQTHVVLSRSTLHHELYARYFFLDSAAASHISTRFATPVHAGCVTLAGRGALLCGDSGAGKSTLSFACARAGFGYVSDDASFLLNHGNGRVVTGNCNLVRLRPAAAQFFPEIAGMEITPRAAGKPSIELPTVPIASISRVESTSVDFLVFLNRHTGGPPELVPHRRDKARAYLRQVLFGSGEQLAMQYDVLERLLTAQVFELRYTELNWAVDRLQTLLRKGV